MRKIEAVNKTNSKQYFAFSMIELIVVFIILAIILLALPRFSKKMEILQYTRYPHGRFECWLETTPSGKIVLKQYYVQESASGKITGGEDPEETEISINSSGNYDEYCQFAPPKNPSYIVLNAIGGGGAGAMLPAGNNTALKAQFKNELPSDLVNPDPANVVSGYKVDDLRELVNNGVMDSFYFLWPDWLQKYYALNKCGGGSVGADTATCKHDQNLCYPFTKNINTYVNYKYAILGYRNGGTAGKIASMFVPSIPQNATLFIKPGLGGIVKGDGTTNGEDGKSSMIEVNYNISKGHCFDKPNECTSDCCIMLEAKGGAGGQVKDQSGNVLLTKATAIKFGGKPTDYGLSELPQVKGKKADFKSTLDNISKANKLKSKVFNLDLGSGGNGANHYLSNNSDSTSTQGELVLAYKRQEDSQASWSEKNSNIAGCFTNSSIKNILKSLNNSDFNDYDVNCSIVAENGSSKFVCASTAASAGDNPCANRYTSPAVQNSISVCPAKNGNHGGVVIIW